MGYPPYRAGAPPVARADADAASSAAAARKKPAGVRFGDEDPSNNLEEVRYYNPSSSRPYIPKPDGAPPPIEGGGKAAPAAQPAPAPAPTNAWSSPPKKMG